MTEKCSKRRRFDQNAPETIQKECLQNMDVLFCVPVLTILFEYDFKSTLALLSCKRTTHRDWWINNNLKFQISTLEDLRHCLSKYRPKKATFWGALVSEKWPNFQVGPKFVVPRFNTQVVDFGNIVHFECKAFNQPVSDFCNVKYFHCNWFNQPVQSFGKIKHFQSAMFNQPLENFGKIETFICFSFNQAVSDFGQVKLFWCNSFNQFVHSFGAVENFQCRSFNQPIVHFGWHLKTFKCANFNQFVGNFCALEYFCCDRFNQPVFDLGQLLYFSSDKFNNKIPPDMGRLTHFLCANYERRCIREKRILQMEQFCTHYFDLEINKQ